MGPSCGCAEVARCASRCSSRYAGDLGHAQPRDPLHGFDALDAPAPQPLDTARSNPTPFLPRRAVIGAIGTAHVSRISSSSRCRRCFPCCGPSSTFVDAAGRRWSASFYAASGLVQFAAGFAVDRFGARPVLLAGLACWPGRPCCAAFAPAVSLAVPDRRADGRRQRRVPSCRLRDPQCQRHAAAAGPRVCDARRRRQPGLRRGADRELRAATRVRLARGLAVMGSRASWCWRPARAASATCFAVAPAGTRGRTLDAREHRPVPPGGDPRCASAFSSSRPRGVGRRADVRWPRINAGFGVPLVLANVGRHRVSPRRHGRHHRRRLPRRALERHDLVAAAGCSLGADARTGLAASRRVASVCGRADVALIGFAIGSTGPSRDLIVRNATPKGAAGRVYGFVYSGLDLGAMIGPVLSA